HSAHDVSTGGLLTTLVETCLAGGFGARVRPEDGVAAPLQLVGAGLLGPAAAAADAVTAAIVEAPARGDAVIGEAGWLVYEPHADVHGADRLVYRLCAAELCADGLVRIVVTPVNDGPVARPDRFAVDTWGTTVLDLVGNDVDVDGDELAVVAVSPATTGDVSVVDGEVRYVPTLGERGPATFSYTVSDGEATAVATVDLLVAPPDLPAVAVRPWALATAVGEPAELDVAELVEDPDGGPVEVLGVGAPLFGTAELVEEGRARYTPAPGTAGYDRFDVEVAGADGAVLRTTVTVTVASSPGAPVLRWSSSVDRSTSLPAPGELVLDGPVAIFVAPDEQLATATFHLDDPVGLGTPLQVELLTPFDLAGTAADGNATLFDPSALAPGEHLLTVRLELADGNRATLHLRLVVGPRVAPPPEG
ncbi:MAG: tandem-95 repeat protein, partial [Acidimicrobiia bacterium]|nr:tandem-95 repeat protein [Acidimicrobiia bacterium]